jgi:hypothetical protein
LHNLKEDVQVVRPSFRVGQKENDQHDVDDADDHCTQNLHRTRNCAACLHNKDNESLSVNVHNLPKVQVFVKTMTEESIPIHKLANLVLVSSSVRIHVPAVDDKFVVDLKFVKEETREQDDVEDEGRNCNTGDDQHVCPFKANHFHAAKKPCFSV